MAVMPSADLSAWLIGRLESLHIQHYKIHPNPKALARHQQVCVTWLEDALGDLLVIYSANYLLDLSYIWRLTGRPFEPIGFERQQHKMSQFGLGPLSALLAQDPQRCLCEARLLEQPSLLWDLGQTGYLLELLPQGFASLLGARRLERFGIALSGLEQSLASETSSEVSFTYQRMHQRLASLTEIPPMPRTAARLAQLRNNPNATVDDLTFLVETDPALAAQVVSWASTSHLAYAAPEKISSVRDAIVRALGFERVINLALGLSLKQSLHLPDQQALHTSYWSQAIYVAMVVDGLVQLMPAHRRPDPGLAYLVGLLHNFGTLILAHVFPPYFSSLCQHQEANPHVSSDVIEHYLLGVTREQISTWLMQNWHMPSELVTAMYCQRNPQYQGAHAMYPNLIYVAVHLLRARGLGRACLEDSAIPLDLLARLGFNRAQAEAVLDRILEAESELRELARKIQAVAQAPIS